MDSVDPKHATAGLLTLAGLLLGLVGSIVYRVAVEDHSRTPLATTPTEVLDPLSKLTVGATSARSRTEEQAPAGAMRTAERNAPDDDAERSQLSPTGSQQDSEAEVLVGYQAAAATIDANARQPSATEINWSDQLFQPSAAPPDAAADRSQRPRFVAPSNR